MTQQLSLYEAQQIGAPHNGTDTSIEAAVAAMTCSRCPSTTFAIFEGPSGRAMRCTKCGQRAQLAVCRCGHGMQAHSSHGGCEAATDTGAPCGCGARCPR